MAFGRYLTNADIRRLEEAAYKEGVKKGNEIAIEEFYKHEDAILQSHRVQDICYLNATFLESLMRIGWGNKRLYSQLIVMNKVEDEINEGTLTIADIIDRLRDKGIELVPDEEDDAESQLMKEIKEARERRQKERENDSN